MSNKHRELLRLAAIMSRYIAALLGDEENKIHDRHEKLGRLVTEEAKAFIARYGGFN